MNILWVKAGGFLPLDSGGKIRSYNIVRQLANSHAITVFTFYAATDSDSNPALQDLVHRAICLPMQIGSTRAASAFRYAPRFFSGRPFAFLRYCRPAVSAALREVALSETFDVILCDFLLACGVIPWDLPTPKVLFTHNVEARIWQRHYETTGGLFWKIVFWREWRATLSAERTFLRRADHVLTVSDADRDYFADIVDSGRITSIPTGVDTNFFAPAKGPQLPNSLVFTGSMDWMPNEDGMRFFLEKILPLILLKVPGARLTIVGKNPSSKLKRIIRQHPSVTLTGRVEDVRPYLAEAEVCIVPLRVGSGTRLKIFEAMAMGKAVVTTTLGAEGLPVTHDRNILIADSPEIFAATVVSLMTDALLRKRLEDAARTLVEREYGWPSVSECVARSIQRFLAVRSANEASTADLELNQLDSSIALRGHPGR
jgi:polysaccharide biosynthesis protein PslH